MQDYLNHDDCYIASSNAGNFVGAIIVFVTSAGEFGVPFKLSAPYGWETLTTQIFSKAVGDDVIIISERQ